MISTLQQQQQQQSQNLM